MSGDNKKTTVAVPAPTAALRKGTLIKVVTLATPLILADGSEQLSVEMYSLKGFQVSKAQRMAQHKKCQFTVDDLLTALSAGISADDFLQLEDIDYFALHDAYSSRFQDNSESDPDADII